MRAWNDVGRGKDGGRFQYSRGSARPGLQRPWSVLRAKGPSPAQQVCRRQRLEQHAVAFLDGQPAIDATQKPLTSYLSLAPWPPRPRWAVQLGQPPWEKRPGRGGRPARLRSSVRETAETPPGEVPSRRANAS